MAVLPHIIFLLFASSRFLPSQRRGVWRHGRQKLRFDERSAPGLLGPRAHVFSGSRHLTDQSLDGLTPPTLEAALKRAQVPIAVAVWITALEVGQELQRGLIRIGIQALQHL